MFHLGDKSMLTSQQFILVTGSRPFGALSGNYILHGSPLHTPRGLHHAAHTLQTFKRWMEIFEENNCKKRTRRKMRKYRARRTELGRELNRSKGSRNEESGKGRMDSGHKRKGETKWRQEYTAQRGRTPRSKHGMEMRSWRHLYHFLPDLEDDKIFWHLHELEKVLKLGQVVAAFQTQKQFFCWASHCNTLRFRALYFFWTGQSELS